MNDSYHQDYSFDESSSLLQYGTDRVPAYIPPPPSHNPPRVDENRPYEQRKQPDSQQPRVPFRLLNAGDDILSHSAEIPTSHLRKSGPGTVPSSAINKTKLVPVSTVIHKYPNLLCESKIGTLAVKLAKDSFFGEDVMVQCTVAGERDLPGLPTDELRKLKDSLFMRFPHYWQSPHEFEPLWRNSTAAIGQACKRLRTKSRLG